MPAPDRAHLRRAAHSRELREYCVTRHGQRAIGPYLHVAMNTASVELLAVPVLHASGDSAISSDGCARETEVASPGINTVCSEGVLNGSGPTVSNDTLGADAKNEHNVVQSLHNASVADLASSPALLEVQASLICERTESPLISEVNSVSLPAATSKRSDSDEPVRDVAMDTSPVGASQADRTAKLELEPQSRSGDKDVAESSPRQPEQSPAPQYLDCAGDASENCSVEQVSSDIVCHLLKCVDNGGESDDMMIVSTANVDQQSESVDKKQADAGSPPKCSPSRTHVPTKVRLVPYRENEEGTSSSDSSSSSSSDSEDEVVVTAVVRCTTPKGDADCSEGDDARPAPTKRRGPGGKPPGHRSAGLKTPGELGIDDLPPIEDLHITLPRTELRQAGRVRHAVDQLLVVESEPGQPVLDLDSVLFRADGTAMGRVFDVLGPVAGPYYTVRFNSAEELAERGLEPGEPLLYAPLHADVTQYVLESEIRKLRGSDASWENNNEPPLEHLDFSDDEQEREVRKQLRAARSGGSSSAPASSAGIGGRPGGDERQYVPPGRGRGAASRGGWNRGQQQRQLQVPPNDVLRPRMEGPPKPRHYESNKPQWPPSQGPQQHWHCSPAAIIFQPNMPPPPSSQAPPWTASPHGNGMPNVWNTPPPPMAAGASSPSWQQTRPFFNQPPMFPNLRTPPPNFGCLMPRMMMPLPSPPQGPFPAHRELSTNPSVGTPGGQQAAAMNLHTRPLQSPVYNGAGQRVPLYDPVPDLNRILTSPTPSAQ